MSAEFDGAPDALASWEVKALPDNVGAMRSALVAFAAHHGADVHTQDSVALACSEALSNAVMHAFVGRAAGTITVTAERAGTTLAVRVIDDGSGFAPRPHSPGLGWGLPTIAHVTSSFDVCAGPDGLGTEVRLVFLVGDEGRARA